jgi:hypothetical protein
MVVAQTADSTATEALWSVTPKFNPDVVTDAKPLFGPFRTTLDAIAASNENMTRPVPANAATVATTWPNTSANAFDLHLTVVAATHEDVRQLPRSPRPPRSSPAVAV